MAQLGFHRRPNGLGTKKTWNTKPRDWTDRRPHRLVLDRKRFLVKVKKAAYVSLLCSLNQHAFIRLIT